MTRKEPLCVSARAITSASVPQIAHVMFRGNKSKGWCGSCRGPHR